MRILRGLSSKRLACGCVAGVYETYDGLVVAVIDAPGSACTNDRHAIGKIVPGDADEMVPVVKNTSSTPR
jgi:hypothetical protein